MKINIPRHYLYLGATSFLLLLFVLIFAFFVLIPKGKEYRIKKIEYKKELQKKHKYQNTHDETLATLKELQSQNRHIISALKKPFDPQRFQKQNKTYFSQLHIDKVDKGDDEDGFSVYRVQTLSKINTPVNFYSFLDALNKSDWIIGVNFPIEFQREGEMIRSSFTMKVYANNPDINSSTSKSLNK